MAEARRILGYFKLPDKIRPPKSIWHSSKKCEAWIENHMPGGKQENQSGMIDITDWERE